MKNHLSRRTFIASAAATLVPAAMGHSQPGSTGLLSVFADQPQSPGKSSTSWKDAGVLDLNHSPYAKLKTVPVSAVVIEEGFWSKRRRTNVDSSIPSMQGELLAHGRMDNFLRLEGKSAQPQKGPVYSDSDLYKWLEAVAFALQTDDPHNFKTTCGGMIRDIVAAQEPSGYLNTYFQGEHKSLRMSYPTQTTGHELYCIGHMLQGAIAWYRATGDRTLLNAGMRFIDDYLIPGYGPGPNQKGIVAGHPEIEMALVELARTTGKRKYIELAGYILQGDARIPLSPQEIKYMFCGIPFTSRTRLEGHAVRAMYACCGATDYYLETGDPAYWNTLNKLWEDLAQHQLYVTGGVGAREAGEAFGDPYELPNATAYGESCAAIGNMMWNWRMLAASGDAKFTDVMERALYNGINSGMSLDGKTYCYRNPLAFDPSASVNNHHDPEGNIRNPWYDTTCCPPNLERTFASLPGYFYGTSDDGVYVHLYDNSDFKWRLRDGNALNIRQKADYPWSGEIEMTVSPATPADFAVYVRIPGWSEKSAVRVNGKVVEDVKPGSYLALRRRWSANNKIELSFDMSTRLLKANPAVTDDRGRIAFQRGPIVFCMEHLDQPGHEHDMNLAGYSAHLNGTTSARYEPHLLDGVMVLEHPGSISRPGTDPGLYFTVSDVPNSKVQPATLRFIPYYAWANRDPASMQVWIPYSNV